MKLKPIFYGYAVMNVATNCFVDWNGNEFEEETETYDTKEHAGYTIKELQWHAKHDNTRTARRIKADLASNNYRVVKLQLVPTLA